MLKYNDINKKYSYAELMELANIYANFGGYLDAQNDENNSNHQIFWVYLKDYFKENMNNIQFKYNNQKTFTNKMLLMNFIVKYSDYDLIPKELKDFSVALNLNNKDIEYFCNNTTILSHLEDKYTKDDIKRIVEFSQTKNNIISGSDDILSIYNEKPLFSTGFNKIDELFGGGMEFGTVTVLSGDNGSGKSNLAHQIFINNAVKQHNAHSYYPCLFSGELNKRMIQEWIAQTFTNPSDLECYNEVYHRPKREIIMTKIAPLMEKFYIMDLDLNYSITTILSQMQIAYLKGSKIFVIDNLLMIEDVERDVLQKQKNIVKVLKDFAKKNDVIVVLLAHNSKPTRGVGYKPSKHDISGSANITNLVDYVLILDRKYDIEGFPNIAVLSLLKNRPTGRTGEIGLSFEPRVRRYTTLSVNFDRETQQYSFDPNTMNLHKFIDTYYTNHNIQQQKLNM